MSNLPFWLPPGAVIRPIPKIVVKGFEGPPELRQQLVDRLQGAIKQFYLKAAHNHSLGIVDQSVSKRVTDDYTLTYANLMGREVVTIDVAASVIGEEQEKKSVPWDWAVVDFKMPVFTYAYADPGDGVVASNAIMVAKLVFPEPLEEGVKNHPDAHWGMAFWNADIGRHASAEPERPILQWTFSTFHNQVGPNADPADQIEIVSLLVDMRRWPTFEQISVEIYGNLLDLGGDSILQYTTQHAWAYVSYTGIPDDLEDGGGNPTASTRTASTGEVLPVGTPTPYSDYSGHEEALVVAGPDILFRGLPIHGVGHNISMPDYDVLYGKPIVNTDLTNNDLLQGSSYLIDTNLFDGLIGWDFHENVVPYVFSPVMNFAVVDVPIEPVSSIEVSANLFRGTPDWAWSYRLSGDPSFVAWGQWYVEPQYPERFGMGVIARDISIVKEDEVQSPTDETLTGLTFLGTLHMSPKSGGNAWFTPAPI